MFCPNCGVQCPDGVAYCPNCNTQFAPQPNPMYQQNQYQQTPYQQPVYNGAPVQKPSVPGKGLGIAGMVCGIVSFFCLAFVLGLLAVIFGAVGLSKSKAVGMGNGMAVAGIVLGIISIVLWIVFLLAAPGLFAFGFAL